MTETEWLACDDPRAMLVFLRRMASDRKVRLFAVTCCAPILPLLSCADCNRAVAIAESDADGRADEPTLNALRHHARRESKNYGDAFQYLDAAAYFVECTVGYYPEDICRYSTTTVAAQVAAEGCSEEAEVFHKLGQLQPHLVRDIFGNPFRPVTFSPSWRSETAVALASAIYAERAFDRMPILADALEEAGCDHPDVLAHCRGPGPHVRGCWVVDGVLGKS
jgi:hypothetical protein